MKYTNGIRKLIVNADDFGLHHSINEAVEDAHQNGILTSASLVVNGESFEKAIAIAKGFIGNPTI